MMDPFSIVTGTIGIVDVCVRLGTFLAQVKEGSDTIDKEIERLIRDIKSLNAVTKLIQESFKRDSREYDKHNEDEEAAIKLWRETGNILQYCQITVGELDLLIKRVVGNGGSSTFEKVQRFFRKQSKEDELLRLWNQLNNGHHLLEILLTGINMYTAREVGHPLLIISQNVHPNISGHVNPIFHGTVFEDPGLGKPNSDADACVRGEDRYTDALSF
jgi:hypothetical protein